MYCTLNWRTGNERVPGHASGTATHRDMINRLAECILPASSYARVHAFVP